MELALSRLTAMLERREEAAIRLERLAKEHPARCQPLEALGQLAWRKGELEDARTWFRKAVDLQPDSWNVYWDYARLAHSTDSERPSVIAALRRMLALNQTHLDAKLMLAEELFQGKRYGESVVTYNTITNVDPERAPRLFLGKAYALLRMEHFDPLTREQALKYAKQPADEQSARSILTFLERRAEFEKHGIRVEQAPIMAAERRLELPSLPSTSAGENRYSPRPWFAVGGRLQGRARAAPVAGRSAASNLPYQRSEPIYQSQRAWHRHGSYLRETAARHSDAHRIRGKARSGARYSWRGSRARVREVDQTGRRPSADGYCGA